MKQDLTHRRWRQTKYHWNACIHLGHVSALHIMHVRIYPCSHMQSIPTRACTHVHQMITISSNVPDSSHRLIPWGGWGGQQFSFKIMFVCHRLYLFWPSLPNPGVKRAHETFYEDSVFDLIRTAPCSHSEKDYLHLQSNIIQRNNLFVK